MSSPNPPVPAADNLPADLAAAHALILALQGELATARQQAGERAIEIERLRLVLAKVWLNRCPRFIRKPENLPHSILPTR